MIEQDEEIEKVKIRVPKWFKNKNQINSRILLSFLELYEEDSNVMIENVEHRCGVKTFKTNFQQMHNFGKRNHAKVFEIEENNVYLWEPVKEFILNEYRSSKL